MVLTGNAIAEEVALYFSNFKTTLSVLAFESEINLRALITREIMRNSNGTLTEH